MKKTYVFGDIHGCAEAFRKLLSRLSPDPEAATLVFLGDYIDRGPSSKEVVAEVLRLRERFRVITLMGNHEAMLLDFLAGRISEIYLKMGGSQTLASYGITDPLAKDLSAHFPAEHLRFFSGLLPYWEDDEYIYAHAGLKPGVPLHEQTLRFLLWIRDEFVYSNHDFGKRVIFGHTPALEPRIEPNKIGIDTGAVYGGELTCLILPDYTLAQPSLSG